MTNFCERLNHLAAAVALAATVLITNAALAQQSDDEPRGKIVRIGEDPGGGAALDSVIVDTEEQAEPRYWIGISGRGVESPVLRTQLQLAEEMGVVVETVADNSPADKAGIRRHDILLRANGQAVHNMRVLQDVVLSSKGKPIELKIIRLGKETDLTVTPEDRPANVSAFSNQRLDGRGLRGDQRETIRRLLERFGEPGELGELGDLGVRMIAPGIIMQGPAAGGGIRGNLSISVKQDGDGPAEVTVRRGDETWTVREDNPESIKALPEDIRPHIEPLLRGGAVGLNERFDFNTELRRMMPQGFAGGLGGLQPGGAEAEAQDEVLQRMEELELQIEQLRDRLEAERE